MKIEDYYTKDEIDEIAGIMGNLLKICLII